MVAICLYFQVHQPFRMNSFNVFDINKKKPYFDSEKNKEIMQKVAKKCYLPTNNLMLKLLKQYPQFKISYSITATAIEQFKKYSPEVLDSFKKLVKTGRVELLAETSHHSLSYLFSKEEFMEQVRAHHQLMEKEFSYTPKVFRNTELIYDDNLAPVVKQLGYKAILAEGADHVLGWKSPNFVYASSNGEIKLLLKNYKLSDDIAFRFSDKSWSQHPLTADRFASWVNEHEGNADCINLFMDYETFGEHQWKDSGIFSFLEDLPNQIFKNNDHFVTPYELAQKESVDNIDVPFPVSWADTERDVSAWTQNKMQQSALSKLYELKSAVKETNDKKLLDRWKKLTTSDHFYYMCVKWFSDGDVHKYFNPYDSPYDSFINFMNILKDIEQKVKGKKEGIQNIKSKVY